MCRIDNEMAVGILVSCLEEVGWWSGVEESCFDEITTGTERMRDRGGQLVDKRRLWHRNSVNAGLVVSVCDLLDDLVDVACGDG